ncbi:Predicted arabinose efflux permease, MFS family [Microlunatus sagamiharensis]|uniref:Predicted arabinose efflux permease, MFS family n=1 Tax=Microlunatus sagamiharensis TaxID=546874 RepID=A0A1H2M0F9_9ACTN|nr:MFS transporter [Microlunatus sagamiharensis]SDU86720.1 Predicted arabinose efflux permease, MFS family [Microlunatus sagamiharensis]
MARAARRFGAYATVLGDAPARGFSLAGFVARLPQSMTGIGIVLLVSLTSGSFARAGVVAAAVTLAGAVAAPLWGRVMDRAGQARVLVGTALGYAVGVLVVVASVEGGWPLPATVGGALLAGLCFTPTGSSVRARWSHRLRDSPLLDTAFALEAVIDELTFVVGPVLVTFLATTVDPAAGLVVCAVLGVLGSLLLAVQRSTEPPRRPRLHRADRTSRLPFRLLAMVVLASWACGGVFGSMEVVVVAFARERDVLGWSGVLLMCWAAGSLLAGVVAGLVAWRRAPLARYRIGAVVLAVSLLPMPFVGPPWLLGVLLTVSGFAIAPTLIAAVSVVQTSVPAVRLTEALGWSGTGMSAGVATGAALGGASVDQMASTGGFVLVAAFGLLLVVGVLLIRTPTSAGGTPVLPVVPVVPESRGAPDALGQPAR